MDTSECCVENALATEDIIGADGTLEHILHQVKPGEHLDLIVKTVNG